MGEAFYRELEEFRKEYPTDEEQEKALRTMSAEKIMQLARSCGSLLQACRFARYAQQAADRECCKAA